ncbi:MAG: lysophospholipid acyltransferase family protein [Gemmatimonadota bacterium]
MTWYAFFKAVLRTFARTVSRVEVEGAENVPAEGPFILAPNHQSVLDPIYIQSAIRRNDVFTMTKSTQFGSAFFRWVLPRINALPARRYKVDPQVVRASLRHLDAGHGVCVYPEGERTWDGRIGRLRRGTLRLILKAGVPVVPCGIQGSFDVWPRWSRRIRRQTVTVRFGRSLRFEQIDDRKERDGRLGETERRIRAALSELSGAPLAGEEEGSHRGGRERGGSDAGGGADRLAGVQGTFRGQDPDE